jgi:hypothetical protein
VGFEMRPFKRMRIIQNWTTDRYHDAAFGLPLTTIGSPAANQVSFTAPGSPAGFSTLQVVNYNQEQVDVLYDVSSRLTLRGGYRRVWGDATTDATPFLNLNGTTLEQGQLNRNVGLAGLNFRVSEKISVNLDYEGAASDNVYFRDSLNNYQKARARAKYRVLPSLVLQANFSVLNNYNHAPSVQYDFRSRDNSLAFYWTPKGAKRIGVTGEYDRGTLKSNTSYLMLPFFTPTLSNYRDDSHSVTGLVDISLPGPVAAKLSMGGSMFLSNGSNTTHYYQPLARLSIPVGKHINWNTEWKYYGYQESFFLYESFRTHVFMTGVKLTR